MCLGTFSACPKIQMWENIENLKNTCFSYRPCVKLNTGDAPEPLSVRRRRVQLWGAPKSLRKVLRGSEW
jgi:hypothetical protein